MAWRYVTAGLVGAGARMGLQYWHPHTQREYNQTPGIPGRRECIGRLKRGEFDILVIGGGAVGAGVALEAASRGLSCALVEKGDFAGQTSSKSTKLLHGGVRYLEQAVQGKHFVENLQLVTEALRERSILLRIAPQMNSYVPLVVPVSSLWEFIYYYCGLWCYHLIAKGAGYFSGLAGEWVPPPYALLEKGLKEVFPALKKKIPAGVVYYDGQMNDSRLCLTVLLTAISKNYIPGHNPAHIANYCVCESLLTGTGRISGALVRDLQTNEVFPVTARVVVNCTGPFSDSVRRMAGKQIKDRIIPAKGSHIILKGDFCSNGAGLLVPKTKDGRVLFFLPWHGHTLAGTTDAPGALTYSSKMDKGEQDFMLMELAPYLGMTADELKPDVIGSFSGLRPLVQKSSTGETKEVSRSHEIELLGNGLVSIMGGKWTTFRSMAQEAIDLIIDRFGMDPKYLSRTEDLFLLGYLFNSKEKSRAISKEWGVGEKTAERLVKDYGNRVDELLREKPELNVELVQEHTYLKSEVVFACRKEFALTALDVLLRRMRLGLEDHTAARNVVPEVVRLMASEFNWSAERAQMEVTTTLEQLEQYAAYQ